MSAVELHVADGFTLPIDLVTEPIGILANRGRGKSYTTHVLVEEIHQASVPVVVLDVKGDWWGLRSSSDGKSDGLPFYIFGGDHADLPLEPTAGEVLADLVVDERVSVVLDLSLMSKTKARSFTTAFAERLYHRNRDNVFIVVDEADVLIPQRVTAETARLLGAMEDIAKRGRGRGIGMAVVTQRPQEVAKSVLDLMDTLVLLGMTGPRSLKSVREWIGVHVDEDTTADQVMATLPALPVGTAWFWSPMIGILRKVQVRRIRTFDSHVTPRPGQTRPTPRTRADVDLDTLRTAIADTVEQAKANDPKALRTRVRDLEEQLRAALEQQPAPERVEVKVPDEAAISGLITSLLAIAEKLDDLGSPLSQVIDRATDLVTETRGALTTCPAVAATPAPAPRPRATATAAAPRPAGDSAVHLGKTERAILTVLVQHGPRTHSQIALLSGYSPKASTIGVSLAKLRKVDLVTHGQPVAATDAGHDAIADQITPLPAGRELIDYWRNRFGLTERRVLDVLLDAWPEVVDQTYVAEQTSYSPTASTIGVALAKLRKAEVVDGWRLSAVFAQAVGL